MIENSRKAENLENKKKAGETELLKENKNEKSEGNKNGNEIITDLGSNIRNAGEFESPFGPIIECVPQDGKGGVLEKANMSAGNVLVRSNM